MFGHNHTNFARTNKKVRDRSHAPKNANSDCCYAKLNRLSNMPYYLMEFAFLPNSKIV